MIQILKDMGITEYEPRVINQMLEFTYSAFPAVFSLLRWSASSVLNSPSASPLLTSGYVTTIIEDAKIYATHAKKSTVDADDIKLAIQCRMDQSFTSPPPRDVRHCIISVSCNEKMIWLFVCGLKMWSCMFFASVFAGGGPTEEPDPTAVNQTLHRPPTSSRSLLSDGPQLQAEDCAEKGAEPAFVWLLPLSFTTYYNSVSVCPGVFDRQQDIRSSPQRRRRLQQTQHTHFR